MKKYGIFNQPLAPSQRKSSKGFQGPTKEQATTGDFMGAGDNYGTGFRAKVGSEKRNTTSTIPTKASKFNPPRSLA